MRFVFGVPRDTLMHAIYTVLYLPKEILRTANGFLEVMYTFVPLFKGMKIIPLLSKDYCSYITRTMHTAESRKH